MNKFNLEQFVDLHLDEMYELLPTVFIQTYTQDKKKECIVLL